MSRRQSRNKSTITYRVGDEYSFLDEDEDAVGSSRKRRPVDQDNDEDGDNFMPDANAEEDPEDDFDEDLVEEEEESDGEAADEDEQLARESSVIGADDVQVTPSRPSTSKGKSKAAVRVLPQAPPPQVITPVQVPHSFARSGGRKVNMDDQQMRSRGIADFSKQGGQEVRLKDLFGPAFSDLSPIRMTRDEWKLQEALPIRGIGVKRSYFESSEARAKDEKQIQAWYADTGRAEFMQGQITSTLTQEQGAKYMLNEGSGSINVLLGVAKSPMVYPLKKNGFVNIADPFKDKDQRRGWLFHLGSRIQEAQWMTNEDGRTQYLAVATQQKDMTAESAPPMEQASAPAFSATKPFAASIQIWAFESTKNGAMSTSKEPRLAIVICADWGAPKHIRWSPIVPHDREIPLSGNETVDVGFLAGIWSDGRVRVLNIEIAKANEQTVEPVYMHFSQAAFEASIPQTVPTCLQWLSGSTLAVGTAAGTLAVWTLTRPGTLSRSQSTSSSPRPWLYRQIGDTYVLTLLSGWPSQPQFLSASTADGFARLYDIRSPDADTVASVRGRVLVTTQAWHEHTQSFVMPDEYYILKHNNIRRFYHNIYSARAESSIVRVATSPVHPGILIGGANGAIFATNPVGRVVNTKVVPWQQNWFVHEWRPPVEQMVTKPPGQNTDAQDGEVQQVTNPNVSKASSLALSEPMVRITEGYKAVQPGIAYSTTSKKKPENENSTLITIYEEKSSVSALAWNPNLKFGTWAVAGMNSGLLRVEDIGV
jgi:transcription factor C subunit 6